MAQDFLGNPASEIGHQPGLDLRLLRGCLRYDQLLEVAEGIQNGLHACPEAAGVPWTEQRSHVLESKSVANQGILRLLPPP